MKNEREEKENQEQPESLRDPHIELKEAGAEDFCMGGKSRKQEVSPGEQMSSASTISSSIHDGKPTQRVKRLSRK